MQKTTPILQTNQKPNSAKQFAGKVQFVSQAGQDFLFFVPNGVTPQLKALKNTMWSLKDTTLGKNVFRAATSVEALLFLRETLGQLLLTKEVHEWYANATQVKLIDEVKSNDILFNYQKEAVSFLAGRKRAMLSLSPGLGKTLVSSYSASLTNARSILVIAPASLLYMWKSELEKWSENLAKQPVVRIWNSSKKFIAPIPKAIPLTQVYWDIANPEAVVSNYKFFSERTYDLVILDESTYYKNRKAQRTKKIAEITKNKEIVWLLTGSPATRYLDDLWSQFNIINPKAYSSYWRFAETYCVVDKTNWGTNIAANKVGAEEQIKKKFSDIYFARSQEEVTDIPDWLFEEIDCVMTPEQEKYYTELEIELKTEILKAAGKDDWEDLDETQLISVNNHLAMVTRLLQFSSNPSLLGSTDTSGKWENLLKLFEFYPKPFIVWTTYIESAKQLSAKIAATGMKTDFMIGETKPEERQTLVDSFQAGKLDCLVLGQAVGSFGLTLTKARTAFYLERNFDGSYFQSLYRVRRIGTTERPVIVHLRSVKNNGQKTIDHVVHDMLDYRVGMIKNLTVGMLREIL